jgi:hypothetical protein
MIRETSKQVLDHSHRRSDLLFLEPEVGFEPTTFRLRVGAHPSSRSHTVRFWLLTSAGSSIQYVPDLPRYGWGNDQENDQPVHSRNCRAWRHDRYRQECPRPVGSAGGGLPCREGCGESPSGEDWPLAGANVGGGGDTAGEARAAASEHGRPLTETVSSLATEPPAAMPVSRPGRPAYSTDFCPQLITFTREEDGREQSRRAGPG